MKFILIVLLSTRGGFSLNTWQQPGIAMASFDDRPACEAAISKLQEMERQTRLEGARLVAACVPAASEERKQ